MTGKNTLEVQKPDSTSRGGRSGLSRRILVVDDEPLICQLYTEILIAAGYAVDAVEDGAVAWDAIQLNSYDLLITDHEMPNVTGIELLKKLEANHVVLPVIMVSGTMPTAELERYPLLRLDAALRKPFNIIELTDMVKKVLHETDNVANSAQLFRDRALNGNQISQAEKPANATIRDQTNLRQRILVVDDDSDTRQLSTDVLISYGYDVEGVKDGAARWEALQNNSFDLVITDNKMPRMTGIEMIEKLRSARMTLPVIMATGNLPRGEFVRRPWLKPDASLERPFSSDDLLATVKNILHTNDGGQQALLPK
jgi:DNA-binding response OmpR family regulator